MINAINGRLLAGKKGLIMGVANNLSIAWHIAKLANEYGAELALTYQSEALERRLRPLAETIGVDIIEYCDVTDSNSIRQLCENIKNSWGKLDFIVHAVAFADKNELKGRFLDTTLPNFQNCLHISCYSLVEIAKTFESIMTDNSNILTLTYHGSTKVMPSYNVMGIAKAALEASVKYLAADLGPNNIRVNAISAGPIKTLAMSAIGDSRAMLRMHAASAPMRRNSTQQDVAGAAVYLLSDLAAGVTGEIHYVDNGYNIMGTNLAASGSEE